MAPAYTAVRWQSPAGVRVSGRAFSAFFDNLSADAFRPVLEKYGWHAEDVDLDGWYDYQMLMDIEREVFEAELLAPVSLGRTVAASVLAAIPVDDMEDYVENKINVLNDSIFRGVPEGFGYMVEKKGRHHYHVTCNMPTHSSVIYGALWQIGQSLTSDGEKFTIAPLTDMESTAVATYELKWGAKPVTESPDKRIEQK